MIAIQRISSNDWREWRELRLEALREAPYAYGSTLAQWQGDGDTEERWRHRLESVPFNVIAYLDERPAGIVSATHPDENASSELISMWVAPFARGRGAGDALVQSVVQWAHEQRLHRIALAVTVGNEHALALYSRHGFVDAGIIEDGERSLSLSIGA
jgi:RimJ/RimL family protein N-acetyltransferase